MYTALVILASALAGLTVLFLFFGISRVSLKNDDGDRIRQMMASITESEIEVERANANLPSEKTWTGYWYNLATSSGIRQYGVETPGRFVIGIILLGAGIGYLVFPGGLLGAVALGVAGPFLIRAYLQFMLSKRLTRLEKQLPALLSGLRASLSAASTPQQAIVTQANEIDGPLGEELRLMKEELAVNVPLDEALANLSYRVPAKEFKFLISSIRIAIKSGSDLEPLIVTIQNIVSDRQRVANHLSAAVANAQPAIFVSAGVIPAAFLFQYYTSEENRAFFESVIGLIGLAVVAVLYVAGLLISRKQVDRVKKA